MPRSRWFMLLMFGVAVMAGGTFAQEPKDKKTDPKVDAKEEGEPKVYRGFLPANWKQLGLTDQQKQEIYKRQAQYRDKIGKLEAQIEELKNKQKKELEDVLTADQKKRLREILLEKSPPSDK